MRKKLLSALLVWTIGLGMFSPILLAQVQQTQQEINNKKRKEEEKQKKDEEKRRKKEEEARRKAENGEDDESWWDKTKSKAKKVGEVAVDVATGKTNADPIALTVGAFFNIQLPLTLDASKVYKEVPTPTNFKPVYLNLTIENIDKPLPPGDYCIDIHTVCTKDSVHIPGAGVGYKLAPMQGAQADALAALIVRGDIAQVSHNTIQMIAWEIQASIPYGEMPKEHQAIVDRLIPEYKKGISGGFLQRVQDRYQDLVGKNSKVLPLDQILEQAGVGETFRSINRSRNIIREENFNYQRSQQRLYDPSLGERVMPADPSQPSVWTEAMPGVYTQIIIKEGWQGRNELNIRVTPQAGTQRKASNGIYSPMFLNAAYFPPPPPQLGTVSVAGLFGFSVIAASPELLAFIATPQGAFLAASLVLIGGVAYIIADKNLRPRIPSLNPPLFPPDNLPIPVINAAPQITFSQATATQALIPSPMIGGNGGGSSDKAKDAKIREAFEKQLEKDGRRSLENALKTISKNLQDHLKKLDALKANGGYTSSVEREIETFQRQIRILKEILSIK